MSKHYLRTDVYIEPLFCGWYAWPHLIPPATAGCNVIGRHLRIMESYVSNPEVHKVASKNPAMVGGSFASLPDNSFDAVTKLIETTKERCGKLIELANAIKSTSQKLENECTGGSITEQYEALPNELRGMVELCYDLSNHPMIRLIEPLIYDEYYDPSLESILLSRGDTDNRPFVLSTPRLAKENDIEINVPFSDPRWDQMFKARREPVDINEMMSLFEIDDQKKKTFLDLFTEEAPELSSDANYTGDELRIRYLGHACVLIQTKDVSVIIDPMLSSNASSEPARYTLYDLPDKIDYLLLTHCHQDHIHIETLLQIRDRIGAIVVGRNRMGELADPSLPLLLNKIGFNNVIALDEMESIDITGGSITAIPFLGEHADLSIQSKIAHFVQLNGKKILLAADSDNIEPVLYEKISKYTGDIDILFVGMECDGAPLSWLYGPYLNTTIKRSQDRARKLSGSDCKKAISIVDTLHCKQAYIYAMGREPWLKHIMGLIYDENSKQLIEANKFIEECKERGVETENLYGKAEIVI